MCWRPPLLGPFFSLSISTIYLVIFSVILTYSFSSLQLYQQETPTQVFSCENLLRRKSTSGCLSHSNTFFNNVATPQADHHKHLGLTLDSKLIFDIHIKSIVAKVNKTLCLTLISQPVLLGLSFVGIRKGFIRRLLDQF